MQWTMAVNKKNSKGYKRKKKKKKLKAEERNGKEFGMLIILLIIDCESKLSALVLL